MSFVSLAEMATMEQLPPKSREYLEPLSYSEPSYVDPSSYTPRPPEDTFYYPSHMQPTYNYKFDPVSFYKQPFMDRIQLPILISILYLLLQIPLIPEKYIKNAGLDTVFYHETTGQATTELKLVKSIAMGVLFYFVHFICFLNMT
jgi:hypothetical protein